MKYRYLVFLSVLISVFSCNKDSIVENDKQVGISKISYFPDVVTIGQQLTIIKQGSAFTDSGATASVHGQKIDYTTSGTVDPSTPGIYLLTYTGVNADGFSSSNFRTVVVLGTDMSANDFSGAYLRGATGETSTWIKLSDGVYQVSNPGGSSIGEGFFVIVVNYSGTDIAIPQQSAFDPYSGQNNVVSSSNELYTTSPAPPQYQWVLNEKNYGASVRIFVKQ